MTQASQWAPYEVAFTSQIIYQNPLHEVEIFFAEFISPTGQRKKVCGFWDGDVNWCIRFMPDELGSWCYQTSCSDSTNAGLHQQTGTFLCVPNTSSLPIYRNGAITHQPGDYHLKHTDGLPFLWVGCTAWNGLLKSTDQEWDTYLMHRANHHYTVIQCVATQWRGGDMNNHLQVAFTGQKSIQINPVFFQHLDRKINKINEYGLVVALVLLWALPYGEGRELSPGFQLPQAEAILLAKYLVARYGAHHVVWLPGGDGLYTSIYEKRWKNIGRAVFSEKPPGLVALHPMGRSWVGDTYAEEDWVDIIGYQSGHSSSQPSVEYITKGPATRQWSQLPPRPIINMEPCYEEIFQRVTADDVRDAAYWSLLGTPIAGVTYGANGIWPWIRKGETILNHGELSRQSVSTWEESINLPGSQQISHLAEFIQQFEWWKLRPSTSLLLNQPGDQNHAHFVSVVCSEDYCTILLYVPHPDIPLKVHNPHQLAYEARWYDPLRGKYLDKTTLSPTDIIHIAPPTTEALALVLQPFGQN
ncbi:apiosidase-like domain-containing protein [Tunicatimonas pelagia]|uniref:apiosidase-like domain-containing protein n=1 Tax=Tunicatimonas pelagia TaxID=931531 RepID=UPI00266602A4|nr:DUF4038 domain-containing protein [Tunicatimonas pelagia]WKN41609.1 DUF4038 domain-containing protein [Tunicatimonas pelagia]